MNLPLQLVHFTEWFGAGIERFRGLSGNVAFYLESEYLILCTNRLLEASAQLRHQCALHGLASLLGLHSEGSEAPYRMLLRTVTLMSLWVRTWKGTVVLCVRLPVLTALQYMSSTSCAALRPSKSTRMYGLSLFVCLMCVIFAQTLVRFLNLLFGSSRKADLFRQVHMKIALSKYSGVASAPSRFID